MSILKELNVIMDTLGIPVETGVFSGKAPDEYAVITPLADTFEIHGDNKPLYETQEARVSLYSKGNYQECKIRIVGTFIKNGFVVTGRLYVGHEGDTGYHHYAVDAAKEYYCGKGED